MNNDKLFYSLNKEYIGPISPGTQKVMNAIDNNNVKVGIYLTDKNVVENFDKQLKWFVIDSYQGTSFDGAKVTTKQVVNTNHMINATKDNVIEKGMIFKHAIIESYLAGKNHFYKGLLSLPIPSNNFSLKDYDVWHMKTIDLLRQPFGKYAADDVPNKGMGVYFIYDGIKTDYLFYDADKKTTEDEAFKIHK